MMRLPRNQFFAAPLWLAVLASFFCAQTAHGDADKLKIIKTCKAATALVDLGVNGSGTAFCIKDSGLFLTNRHVAEAAGLNQKVKLVLNPSERDEKVVEARVVHLSENQELDLALLKVEQAGELTEISLAKDAELVETMSVTAFGYPFGRLLATGDERYPAISINVGRISALRKSKGRLKLIQIDAAINPGNSGGPVIDESGHVIGVIFFGAPAARIIYAIPAEDVREYLKRPLLEMKAPEVRFADRHRPAIFQMDFLEFDESNKPLDVELVLRHKGAPPRHFVAKRAGTTYTVTAPPIDPALGNSAVKLIARFDGKTVVSTIPGDTAADLQITIGSRNFSLYDIRRIEKRNRISIATTVSGRKYAGKITGLPQVAGAANSKVDAADADRLDLYVVDPGPIDVAYEISASRQGVEQSSFSGVVPLTDVPFPEPTDPTLQLADPFAADIDRFLIEAKVDGRSDLHVTRNGLVWEHFSWKPPGENDDKGSYVMVDGRKWYLEWQKSEGERKTIISNFFPLKLGVADWEVAVVSVKLSPDSPHDDARGSVTQTSNDRGTTITIDDTVGGHSYYTILLRKRPFSEQALPRHGPPRTGRWNFEQISGNQIADASGQGNEGLLLRADIKSAIVDVKHGKALNVTGKSSVDLDQTGDFERTDAFSYGAWIKPEPGTSSPLAKMAESNTFQGYDLLLDEGRAFVQLVHSWHEGNAINVGTTAKLASGEWQHVMATYDGSSKAAGVKIYVNGELAETAVEADGLTGSIRTVVPLRIGSRRGGMQYHGLITDVRIIGSELTAEEVRAIAANPPE